MRRSARIIDASANRAREGLRVLEDIARFVLDDRGLSAQIKSVRHGVAQAIASLDMQRNELLVARDTPGDVGTTISTRRETQRAGLCDVAVASAARACESLRTIEELAKIRSPELGARFEQLRYEVYEIERRIVPRLGNLATVQWRLCVLVTEALCEHLPWDEVAQRALAGGADCVQLREQSLGDRALLGRARRLVAMAREHAASVIINDRPDIAVLADADGVHVGQEDLGPAEVRRIVGPDRLVGVSTSCVEQARDAVRCGADLVGIGPMFMTTTKPGRSAIGPGAVRAYLDDELVASVAHLAIGGITPGTIGRVVKAGARGVAVSSCVCSVAEPEAACRELIAAFERAGLGSARGQAAAGPTV